MADEAVSEQVADNPPPAPPPAAAAPPADDTEKRKLEAELQQTKAALGEVAEMVKSGKLKLNDAPAAPAVEEDETALVDRKELKRHLDDVKRAVVGAVVESAGQSARLVRANTKDLMRPKLKNFDKYEAEVDALLDKMDPRQAASPDTISQAYRVVRANHIDEEIEAEKAAWAASRPSDEDEQEEPEPAVPSRIPGAMASPARQPVASVGDASMRPVQRNREVVKPLTRDERVAAQLFGIADAAEYRRYADRSWRPDLLGSKGRQKF